MSRKRTERPPSSPYITPEGARALSEEFDYLWNVDRPKVAEAVRIAAAQGDRSENADYQYGKRRLKICFGAWMRLEDEQGEETIYRIVGPDEFDVAKGYISMDSPVGRALLGSVARPVVRLKAESRRFVAGGPI